jgi:Tfp pilus assembly protein PilN
MMRINLLPNEERPLKQSAVRWEFMALLFGLVLLIVINVYGFLLSVTNQTLEQEYLQVISMKTRLSGQQQEISRLQNQIKESSEQAGYYAHLLDRCAAAFQPKWLASVIALAPDEVWLESVAYSGKQILISGYTVDSQLITGYLQKLQQSGYETQLNAMDQHTLGARLFSFNISAVRSD